MKPVGTILAMILAIGCSSTGSAGGSGGQAASGGSVGSGGKTSTGGVNGSGGRGSGGSTNSGGNTSTGGSDGSGGSVASGGVPGTGGKSESGGNASSGGSTGSGGGSGGVPGGGGMGGPGHGTGGGAGIAGNSGAVVVDDFEGTTLSAALWKIAGQGTITLSTEKVHRGKQSVKVTGSSGRTMMVNSSAFPLPSGVIYFRVWMWFQNGGWMNHVVFAESSPGSESQEVRFGGQQNAYNANLAADGDGLSPNPYQSPSCPLCLTPMPQTWACVRGMLDFAHNAVQLHVGEVLAVDAKMASDWHSGTGMLPKNPTEIGFGWAVYGGGPANDVYYDDLAIGYQPIPCD